MMTFETVKIYVSERTDRDRLIAQLVEFGYSHSRRVAEEGDFARLGENVIIYPITFEYPIRVEFFDDLVERIRSVDPSTYEVIADHQSVIVLPMKGRIRRRRISRKKALLGEELPIDNFVDIESGDYVVHIDHGIGRYVGLELIEGKDGSSLDHLVIEYADGDKLYVPFSDLDKIQKYIGLERRVPALYKLGSKQWKRVKERSKRGIAKVAFEILELQAKRSSAAGVRFSPDTDWQRELEQKFPYKETPDQKRATREVKNDMESSRAMDRLLCGDVGYGKTEVALRSAFKAVMDNRQAAILVPTTILAEQHLITFRERMKDFPVAIECLSRFKTKTEQARIKEQLANGSLDIIIGTHMLLSSTVQFKNLGLVIIDEEQRFGVRHKERLKALRFIVDVLTLTATPIPRTLYLALMGGRDISLINTPPLERLPVETHVLEYDEAVIKEAILREKRRGGQTFFVHNRILGIEKLAQRLHTLVPEVTIEVAHGQMPERALEMTMLRFIKGEIDVLVSTTIVESGIDIPNANTLIVNRADTFGLADLYQLRGRVGRFIKNAYAYFLVPRRFILAQDAQRRLSAIRKYHDLGAGFKVAMEDLQIRGAGNLLGVEQHGYIQAVGFDLYCRLIKNAIDALGASGIGHHTKRT